MVTRRALMVSSLFVFVHCLLISPLEASHFRDKPKLIHSIVKAPVSADGTTAGRPTDIVFNLTGPMDPSVPGRSLAKGKTIKITLPRAFKNVLNLPFQSVGEVPTCVPGNLQCNTAVLLQGWPQHPIRPPFQNYSIDFDERTNTLIYTALKDIKPDPPLEPGIKQFHTIIRGFKNPPAGFYRIKVAAETGPRGTVEYDTAVLRILRKPRASINITSAFNEGTPNTIYQQTKVGNKAPLPYDFLLWDRNGEPFVGVELLDIGFDEFYLLSKYKQVVGFVYVDAPENAVGQKLTSDKAAELIKSPVTAVPTARWTTQFAAGSAPGLYRIFFRLFGGNQFKSFVTVVD